MRQTQSTHSPSIMQKEPLLSRRVCEHRFEIARFGGRTIPDLWVCQLCALRVRRKPPRGTNRPHA